MNNINHIPFKLSSSKFKGKINSIITFQNRCSNKLELTSLKFFRKHIIKSRKKKKECLTTRETK